MRLIDDKSYNTKISRYCLCSGFSDLSCVVFAREINILLVFNGKKFVRKKCLFYFL
jgi:hypothetical protein